MPMGQCKLCLQTRELQDSHLLPKALYKKSRYEGGGNPNPTLITSKAMVQTSEQMKDYVLCRDCEQLFNRNGERYVMSLVHARGRFPLLAALRSIKPASVSPFASHYDLKSLPAIDRAQLAYYALSIFWRASVHIWDKRERTTPVIDLGTNNEVLRKYLIGETGFPKEVVLMLVVCTDNLSQNSFFEPNKGNPDMETYTFITRGLNFFMMLGEQVTDKTRKVCIINGERKMISVRTCEEKVVWAAQQLTAQHKKAKS